MKCIKGSKMTSKNTHLFTAGGAWPWDGEVGVGVCVGGGGGGGRGEGVWGEVGHRSFFLRDSSFHFA